MKFVGRWVHSSPSWQRTYPPVRKFDFKGFGFEGRTPLSLDAEEESAGLQRLPRAVPLGRSNGYIPMDDGWMK